MGIGEIYLDTMNCFRLVFLFGLENELLEDDIRPCHNTMEESVSLCLPLKHRGIPYRQHLAAVGLVCTSNAQPVSSVVDGMRRVKGGLKDHSGFDFAWGIVIVLLLLTERVVVAQPKGRGTSGGLELP